VFVRTATRSGSRRSRPASPTTPTIEVKSGVKAGDEVVSGTYAAISRLLKDGSKIRIEKPKVDGRTK
jgi:hypothetical protein